MMIAQLLNILKKKIGSHGVKKATMGASLDREKTQGQRPGAHLHTVYRPTK